LTAVAAIQQLDLGLACAAASDAAEGVLILELADCCSERVRRRALTLSHFQIVSKTVDLAVCAARPNI
jgi:hypothetical protein